MVPKTYQHSVLAKNLENTHGNNPGYFFLDLSQDIKDILESIAFPKKYRDDITGVVALTYEGDYEAVWVTESAAPYSVYARYHPLPYYRPVRWVKINLPVYWLESNEYYSKQLEVMK